MSSRQAWQEFRAAREAELVQPYGWLTLQGFHWLPRDPAPLEGLPGTWSTDGEHARVVAGPGDGLTVDGEPLDGQSLRTVAETGRLPWLRRGDTEIELLRRGGRLAVRLRSRTSAAREGFTGVPTFDHDPAWVIRAEFIPGPEDRRVDVATHRPDLRQRLRAPGEVEFTLDGRPQRLVVTTIKSGLGLEFHDPTNTDETEAWRQLKFEDPEHGVVTLDFNRTVNMWFAFTDHATCPAPVEGNRISVPVRAGEKRALSRGCGD
ncbi:DUF1684 domain-containing protein [Janibacter sp. GS2]|uniref:DUF1684 domain-containing protein n=1 Tax=Janibacter sp. GS2 TaxID=3442646 RepID=UPI003EBD93E7